MKKYIMAAALAFACVGAAFSQEFGTGLIFEDDMTSKIPQKATLLTRSYEEVPAGYSLKKYAPSVKAQSGGTCVGWSSTYAARTIAEAAANGWTDRAAIDREAFSPEFTYAMIRLFSGCAKGTHISEAVKKLREVGAVKKSEVDESCLSNIPAPLFQKAGDHRVDAYSTTFERGKSPPNFIVSTVKKAVSQNKPVIFGMTVYESFDNVGKSGVWNGFQSPVQRGGHAMCVIGYDDAKEGGAFEIMNSWGPGWGDGGFVWVRYGDFAREAFYGHDIHVNPKRRPEASGSLRFVLKSGEEMKAVLRNAGGLPVYKMARSYISGTKFRIYLSNDNPAYVYVIGSDLDNSVSKIFPFDRRTSAALYYKKNDIALPSEEHLFELDGTEGTTYALVLYSQKELPVDEIVERIRGGAGDFAQKTRSALGGDMARFEEIVLDRQSIKFSTKSGKPVVAIAVETEHAAAGE